MKSAIHLVMALFPLFVFEVSVAGDSFTGKRLFFTPTERQQLEADKAAVVSPVSVNNASISTEPRSELKEVSESAAPSGVVRKHTVSFDGIVIRHSGEEAATSVVWINGEAGQPKAWTGDAVDEYQHKVTTGKRTLYIKPGHSHSVAVTVSDEVIRP